MKNCFTKMALSSAALLLSTSLVFAADVTVKTPDVKGAAKATSDSTKAGAKGVVSDTKASTAAAKDKAKGTVTDAKAKIVDINTASEAELKAVPGIGDTYAAKIVAGRPYANKTQLKSSKIVPDMVYEKVKDLITAKQLKK